MNAGISYYILEFIKGYRVNPANPAKIIDSRYILRSLLALSSIIDRKALKEAISKGRIFTSAFLPLTKSNSCWKPLIPVNHFLTKIFKQITGSSPEYITLKVYKNILNDYNKASNLRRLVDILEENISTKIKFYEKIVSYKDENILNTRILELVREQVNIIDRVSGAAFPYVITGYKTYVPMLLITYGDFNRKSFRETLEILGEIGIGGARSRGWGRFLLDENIKICNEDDELIHQVVKRIVDIDPGRPCALLGSIPANVEYDPSNSILNINSIIGRGVDGKLLPLINVIEPGSILILKKNIREKELFIKISDCNVFIFTSLVLCD